MQIFIIIALLCFVLFVFFGPTGLDGRTSVPTGNGTASLGERSPFALFTPVSKTSTKDSKIDYTGNQMKKIHAAARKASMVSPLYVPRTGANGDYLMEIRVFRQQHMIQLLYPHFGILESTKPIHTEPNTVSSKKTKLTIGPAMIIRFRHGGYHLSFKLKGTYIALDSAKIEQMTRLKKIANSIVSLKKLQ